MRYSPKILLPFIFTITCGCHNYEKCQIDVRSIGEHAPVPGAKVEVAYWVTDEWFKIAPPSRSYATSDVQGEASVKVAEGKPFTIFVKSNEDPPQYALIQRSGDQISTEWRPTKSISNAEDRYEVRVRQMSR